MGLMQSPVPLVGTQALALGHMVNPSQVKPRSMVRS
jgi:hypothetical protein